MEEDSDKLAEGINQLLRVDSAVNATLVFLSTLISWFDILFSFSPDFFIFKIVFVFKHETYYYIRNQLL